LPIGPADSRSRLPGAPPPLCGGEPNPADEPEGLPGAPASLGPHLPGLPPQRLPGLRHYPRLGVRPGPLLGHRGGTLGIGSHPGHPGPPLNPGRRFRAILPWGPPSRELLLAAAPKGPAVLRTLDPELSGEPGHLGPP